MCANTKALGQDAMSPASDDDSISIPNKVRQFQRSDHQRLSLTGHRKETE